MNRYRKQSRRIRKWLTMATAFAAAAALATACGSSGGSVSAGSSSGAVNLSQVTLSFGEQQADWPDLFKMSGLFNNTPYKLEFPLIPGAANQVAALESNAIDVANGGITSAATILENTAQAPGPKGAAVQTILDYEPVNPPYPPIALYAYKSSGITSLADLKGKTIAVASSGQYYSAYLVALHMAHLTTQDVHTALFAVSQEADAAFLAHDVDAEFTTLTRIEPVVASGEAVQIITQPDLSDVIGYGGYFTTAAVLANPGKVAALRDFIVRLREFYDDWYPTHEADVLEVLENVDKQTPEVAKENFELQASVRLLRISRPGLLQDQQEVIDAEFSAGGVKYERPVGPAFNPIFDAEADP